MSHTPWGIAPTTGVQEVAGSITTQTAPGTHFELAWGVPQYLVLQAGNIGNNNLVGTNLASIIVPDGWWLYDVNFQVQGTGTGTITADIFNTVAAGSAAANSYLKTPMVLTASLSAYTNFSARHSNPPIMDIRNDPTLSEAYWRSFPGVNTSNTAGQSPAQGVSFFRPGLTSVISLRAITGAAGSITSLTAIVTAVISNKFPIGGTP